MAPVVQVLTAVAERGPPSICRASQFEPKSNQLYTHLTGVWRSSAMTRTTEHRRLFASADRPTERVPVV